MRTGRRLGAELEGARARIAGLEAQLDKAPKGPSISERIHLVTAEVEPLHKRAADTEDGFDFIAAVDVLAAVREPMLRHGLVITPCVVGVENRDLQDRETKETIPNRLTRVEMDFKLTDTGGHQPEYRRWQAEAADGHAVKKALTEGIKTFYIALFQIQVLPADGRRPQRPQQPATVTRSEQQRQRRRQAYLEQPIPNVVIEQTIRPVQGVRSDDQVDELVRDQFGVDGLALLPRKHIHDLTHLLKTDVGADA